MPRALTIIEELTRPRDDHRVLSRIISADAP
jgi:hypothetical protein